MASLAVARSRAQRDAPGVRPEWVEGERTLGQVTSDIADPLRQRPDVAWWACLAVSSAALAIGAACVTYEIATGIGTWGLNKTVGWAFDITNFVFWIGIGHAGTLISAILLLFRQSEERRVGKECRSRWTSDQCINKNECE